MAAGGEGVIRFSHLELRGRRILRYGFSDDETGLSGEVFKLPGEPWCAAIPGVSDAKGENRLEACERALRLAESGRG